MRSCPIADRAKGKPQLTTEFTVRAMPVCSQQPWLPEPSLCHHQRGSSHQATDVSQIKSCISTNLGYLHGKQLLGEVRCGKKERKVAS